MEDERICVIDGVEECYEEQVLAYLLEQDVLFANHAKEPRTICLYVNCSDIFAWAYSDAESITLDELLPLYKLVIENPKWGSTIWICLKRNEQPQNPIIRDMKKDGVWTEELEALPKNRLDTFMSQQLAWSST
jgi:hypothetical protein